MEASAEIPQSDIPPERFADWSGQIDSIPYNISPELAEEVIKKIKNTTLENRLENDDLVFLQQGERGIENILANNIKLIKENRPEENPVFFRFQETPNQFIEEGESLDEDDNSNLLNAKGRPIGYIGKTEITIIKKEQNEYTLYFKDIKLGEERYTIDKKAYNMFNAQITFSIDSNDQIKITEATNTIQVVVDQQIEEQNFFLTQEELEIILKRFINFPI